MWLVYPTKAEAEAAQTAIWRAIRPPAEVRGDGEPLTVRITRRWAVPREFVEGWAIPAPPEGAPDVGGDLLATVTLIDPLEGAL